MKDIIATYSDSYIPIHGTAGTFGRKLWYAGTYIVQMLRMIYT